jgi:hypothetical protein
MPRGCGFSSREIAAAVLEKRLKEIAAGTTLPPELKKVTLTDLRAWGLATRPNIVGCAKPSRGLRAILPARGATSQRCMAEIRGPTQRDAHRRAGPDRFDPGRLS